MKLISAEVSSFGKLKNFRYEFNCGLNVIRNVNGFGKTTFAAFIRSMLYGFTYKTAKGVTDAAKYAPWDGAGLYGGSIVVSHCGETYRIERFFGKTAKAEKTALFNETTKKPVDVASFLGDCRSFGEKFLGLTAESYDRSAYFPQEAVELSSNDNFDTRLANLVENGADDYNSVQKNLKDYQRSLKYFSGRGGIICESEDKIDKLNRELLKADEEESRKENIEKTLLRLNAESEDLLRKRKELEAQREKLRKEQLKVQPTEEEKRIREKISEIETDLAKTPDFDNDNLECEKLNDRIKNLNDDVRPIKNPHYPLLGASVACICSGVIFAVLMCMLASAYWSIGVGLAVVAAGGVGVYFAVKRKGLQTLQSGEKDSLISEYYKIASKYFYCYDSSFDQVKRKFWDEYKTYRDKKAYLQNIKTKVASSDTKNDVYDSRVEELTSQIGTISARLTSIATENGSLSKELEHISIDKASILDGIISAKEELKKAKFRLEVARETSRLLAVAKDNLSTSYLPKLCRRCDELLKEISSLGYETVIDREFNVLIRENGITKPVADFSRGIREIIFLCFRIALSELLYDKEIPFLIIDDAFVNYDENNFQRAAALVKKLSARTQVVYFTCHSRLGELKN